MTTKIHLSHNIDAVKRDIEDVIDELHDVHRAVRGVMDLVRSEARSLVAADADWKGRLRKSIKLDTDSISSTEDRVRVYADSDIASWAPFVEFGTGSRTGETDGSSARFYSESRLDGQPIGYPFDSPDGPSSNLVGPILEWVQTKPIISSQPAIVVARKIAKTIVDVGTYAHPFLRPAWFQQERQIKRAAKQAVKDAVR